MTDNLPNVNSGTAPNFAALQNVALMREMLEKLRTRHGHLPGLGVMYGPSGFGKTYAAIYGQNFTHGIRVEMGDSWTKRKLLQAILRELGLHDPRGSVADLAEQVIYRLSETPDRPLFVDEADKLVDRGMIELIREIHEASSAPIVLIGEEMLPQKLMRSERTHNRVLEWAGAVPCDLADCRKLVPVFAPNVRPTDALLDLIRGQSDGRARRVAVNLARIDHYASVRGLDELDVRDYDEGFYTGNPPSRRAV